MNDFSILKKYKSIAIMGGTFDPIHFGHLVTAEAVRDRFGIEKIIFIPSGNTPHKDNDKVLENLDRYAMVEMAISGNDFFVISDIETKRDGVSYTFDTVTEIRKHLKDAKLYFITGADAITEIMTWGNASELLKICEFIAVSRPGFSTSFLQSKINALRAKPQSRIHYMEVPALAISSSDVRKKVGEGSSVKYLLPDNVLAFIEEKQLYLDAFELDGGARVDFQHIKRKVKSLLDLATFVHSLGVADEASNLAKSLGVDQNKAKLAGLLHDLAKKFTDDENEFYAKKYDFDLSRYADEYRNVVHQFLGAIFAEHELQILDRELLDAISFHTTGRENMSLLEKVIFIADYIEPNKETTERILLIRDLAYRDIDLAMEQALRENKLYLDGIGKKVHPLSLRAIKYFEEINKSKGEI